MYIKRVLPSTRCYITSVVLSALFLTIWASSTWLTLRFFLKEGSFSPVCGPSTDEENVSIQKQNQPSSIYVNISLVCVSVTIYSRV